ncbi:rhodanese-related sulfurtransferase [Bisgaardia hudsonensis]|uniref:Rhodanese-related sulfurtransferase n=1 Tax=Bisgaardia hudsonensis TaxID=109472 RepID=A0A4R2MWT0_9PAST|nr:rhodanese-like domain-containing protein [Bisgaardia hudsonensis]QLB13826.1 rhodanese-like domain-containing protein [Bisgaardia hudsonensis]TCP11689.1 rhodanese-related sulfurtransferase [Bisgaardia hudsonensis]
MEEYLPLVVNFAKNHSLMVICWFAVFFAVIYTFVQSAMSKTKTINNNEAISLINNEDAIVIDLRSIEEFQKGHIINSLNILPTEIKNHNIGKIEHHKEKPVIVVCATGLSAKTSAELLAKQGFNHVYSLQEGINGWNTANLPLTRKHK